MNALDDSLLHDLAELAACHSTPGDEDETAARVLGAWQAAGWQTDSLGRSAIRASRPADDPALPAILVCAHLDSPGFIVESLGEDRMTLIPVGGPRFSGLTAEALLKTWQGKVPIDMLRHRTEDETVFTAPLVPGVCPGDRVCFAPHFCRLDGDRVEGTFLDNRIGCAILCELARVLRDVELPVRVVLGATTCEEIGGLGAPVLASAVRPAGVVCLDATYENDLQGVVAGGGPVLTLSDTSVLIGCRVRDALEAFLRDRGIPLQYEVYNYSGTDARAFPHAGLPATVYALLTASSGNHSPVESASLRDMRDTVQAVAAMCADGFAAGLFGAGFAGPGGGS